MTRQFSAIVLDLGNVVFEWDSAAESWTHQMSLLLRASMKSNIYHDYERGRMSTEQCHRALGEFLLIEPTEIQKLFHLARQSLRSNQPLLDYIRQLKQTRGVAVYAMSNIPQADIDYLKNSRASDMAIFDEIFTSGYVGFRKPEHDFYQLMMKETGLAPEKSVFVDDKEENVDQARRLGINGICFQGLEDLRQRLEKLFV